MTSRAAELIAEIEELKGMITKLKQENKRLTTDTSEFDQKSQSFEKSVSSTVHTSSFIISSKSRSSICLSVVLHCGQGTSQVLSAA